MKETKRKRTTAILVPLMVGLLACTGCESGTNSKGANFGGELVVIPTPDQNVVAKPFSTRDITLVFTVDPATTNAALTKLVAERIGVQLQNNLRVRGHHVMAAGGAPVQLKLSLKEIRPYEDPELDWRAYVATAAVRVPTADGQGLDNTFVVDGRTLSAKQYYIRESQAIEPVQKELVKQIDEWLVTVLKCTPATAPQIKQTK